MRLEGTFNAQAKCGFGLSISLNITANPDESVLKRGIPVEALVIALTSWSG